MNNTLFTMTTVKASAKNIINRCLGFAPQMKNIVITNAEERRLEFIVGNKGYTVVSTYGIGGKDFAVYMYTVIEGDNFKDGICIGFIDDIYA